MDFAKESCILRNVTILYIFFVLKVGPLKVRFKIYCDLDYDLLF